VLKQNKLTIGILSTLGLALSSASFNARAIQQGDMFMRFTLTSVAPNDSSSAFSAATTVTPAVDSDVKPGATFVYMINNQMGFEVLAALPFKHDITAAGSKIGETKQLPPTFSMQYYFNPQSKIRPYVGLGLNYTTFFSSETISGLGGDLSLDDSFGLAAQVGIDYDINEKWFLSADVRYINISTTATNSAAGSADVDINPTVMSIGAGYKF